MSIRIGRLGLPFVMILTVIGSAFASGAQEEAETDGGADVGDDAPGVAVVFGRGGLGDESFNDAAFRGLEQAGDELGVEFDYAEPQAVAEFEPLLTQFSQVAARQRYELIISIGFEQGDALNAVAQEFPDQRFAIIDTVVEQPNVASYVYDEEERGFLMGAAAALTTTETDDELVNDELVVAVVGGVQSPLIDANIAGFIAGAKYINPDVEALHGYVGSFTDPARGKEIAISFIEQGADVVWGAAGRSGLGVLDAAQEQEVYAMGADSDQSSVAPGHVLTNGMKFVDETVFIAIQTAVEGEFTSGVQSLGVAEGALGYTESLLSDAALERMEEVRQAIVDGEVDIPQTVDAARSM